MKGKRKGVLLVLMLMSVFMLLPLGASAAKLNMTTPLKYAKQSAIRSIAWIQVRHQPGHTSVPCRRILRTEPMVLWKFRAAESLSI